MTLPSPWDEYLRLQSSLDNTTEINNRCWGLEDALESILDGAAANLATTVATAERRERYRARLRRTYPSALWPVVDQPAAIEARVELEQVRRLLDPSDWLRISSLAVGMDYKAIGINLGATPGNLRVRISRIRAGLPLAA
jgi:hypothetical protein